MREERRVVPESDGFYEVSNLGVVYSRRWNHTRRLKPWLNSTGYEVVHISVCGRRFRWLVHRLVAVVFLDGPDRSDQTEVMHKDDNPRNNVVTNLRWGTHVENMRQMAERGRHGSITKPHRVPRGDRHNSRTKPESVPRGERSGAATITDGHVRAIRALAELGMSTSEIARKLEISRNAAKQVLRGKSWRHVA